MGGVHRLARVGGWELDLKSNHLSWTREVHRIHEVEPGYQPKVEEAIQFYAPEAVPVITEAVQRVIAEGLGFDLELPMITAGHEWRGELHNRKKNGELYWESASISPIRNDVGVVTHFVAVKEDITERKQLEAIRETLITSLQEALANVKTLRGLLPICAGCKKIRDEVGYWNRVESYLSLHTEVKFSHGLCPDCARKYFPDDAEEPPGPTEVPRAGLHNDATFGPGQSP